MLDNEFERVEAGWLLDEKRPSGVSMEEVGEGQGFSPKHSPSQGAGGSGLWDYIDKQHRKSAIFTNFLFSPLDQEAVRQLGGVVVVVVVVVVVEEVICGGGLVVLDWLVHDGCLVDVWWWLW